MQKTGASPFENRLKCMWCGDEIGLPPQTLGGSSAPQYRLVRDDDDQDVTYPFAIYDKLLFCSAECLTQFVAQALNEHGARLKWGAE